MKKFVSLTLPLLISFILLLKVCADDTWNKIYGNNSNNVLIGNSLKKNLIYWYGGVDILKGYDRYDILYGGFGNDRLNGWGGRLIYEKLSDGSILLI